MNGYVETGTQQQSPKSQPLHLHRMLGATWVSKPIRINPIVFLYCSTHWSHLPRTNLWIIIPEFTSCLLCWKHGPLYYLVLFLVLFLFSYSPITAVRRSTAQICLARNHGNSLHGLNRPPSTTGSLYTAHRDQGGVIVPLTHPAVLSPACR